MHTNTLTKEELIKRHDYLVNKSNKSNNELKCTKYRKLIQSYKIKIKTQ